MILGVPAKLGDVEVVQHGWFGGGKYAKNQRRISVRSNNLTCSFAIFMLAPRTGIAQVLGCHIVTQPLLNHFLQNLYQLKALDWLFYATKFQQVSSDLPELI